MPWRATSDVDPLLTPRILNPRFLINRHYDVASNICQTLAGGFKIVEILFDSAIYSPDKTWMWSLIMIMVMGSILSAQVKYVLEIANPGGAGFIPQMQVHMLRELGRAVQVAPIKPTLKAPGS
jgi:hypothetical protein